MADKAQQDEGQSHWRDVVWPEASGGTDHLNREGFGKMMDLMGKRSDEKMGGHMDFSTEDLDKIYNGYCEIFGKDKAVGLTNDDFKKTKTLFMTSAAGMAAK